MTTDPPLLDAAQIAARLTCSKRTLYHLIAQGQFPRPLKIGGLSRWSPEAVERFLTRAQTRAERAQKKPPC